MRLCEECPGGFFREGFSFDSLPDLFEERGFGIHVEPILLHGKLGVVPDEFAEIVEHGALGQMNVPDRREDVEQTREARRVVFHQILITCSRFLRATRTLRQQFDDSRRVLLKFLPGNEIEL